MLIFVSVSYHFYRVHFSQTFFCSENTPSPTPGSVATAAPAPAAGCTSADIAVTGFRFRNVETYPGTAMNAIGNGVSYTLESLQLAFGTTAIGVECLTTGPVGSAVTFDNIPPSSAQNVDNDPPYTLDNDTVDGSVFTPTPWSAYGTFNWNVTCTAYCGEDGVIEPSNTLSVLFTMVV